MQEPRPFTVGKEQLAEMIREGGWCGGLRRATFTHDPGWVGYVRKDGTGLALENPTPAELQGLWSEMSEPDQTTYNTQDFSWAV